MQRDDRRASDDAQEAFTQLLAAIGQRYPEWIDRLEELRRASREPGEGLPGGTWPRGLSQIGLYWRFWMEGGVDRSEVLCADHAPPPFAEAQRKRNVYPARPGDFAYTGCHEPRCVVCGKGATR